MIQNQDGNYTNGRENRWKDGVKLVFQVLARKNRKAKMNILDVGCGDGSFYRFLKKSASNNDVDIERVKYFGLDSDNSYRKKVKEIDGSFIYSNATKIKDSVNGNRFDIIIASEIIEHIDETDKFISQIKQVLRHNGYIYLTTPNLAAWHCRLMLLFGFQPLPTEVSNISSVFGKGIIGRKMYCERTIHHIRLFTYKALGEFLKFHKIEVVKTIGGGYRKIDTVLFGNKFISLSPLIIMVLKCKQKKPRTTLLNEI